MGKTCIHIGEEIRLELEKQGHSVQWLSNQLGCKKKKKKNMEGSR